MRGAMRSRVTRARDASREGAKWFKRRASTTVVVHFFWFVQAHVASFPIMCANSGASIATTESRSRTKSSHLIGDRSMAKKAKKKAKKATKKAGKKKAKKKTKKATKKAAATGM